MARAEQGLVVAQDTANSAQPTPAIAGPEASTPPPARSTRFSGIANVRRHTAQGMLINSTYQVALIGLSVLRGLIAAIFLTRADYGIWGLVGLTYWTAISVKTVFSAGDKYVQQSDENQEHAFQRGFTIEVIFTAAALPLAAGIVVAYAALTGHSAVLLPGLVLLLLLPTAPLQFPLAAFYRQMNYRRQRLLSAIDPVIGGIVTVALAALGAGYWCFIGGALAGAWSAAVVSVKASPFPLRWRYDRGSLLQYTRFSVPIVIAAVSVLGLFQALNLVGVAAIGLAGVGTFTLVGNLVQFTDQADDIITGTLYPAVCAVQDRVDVLSEIFVKSNRLSLMWATPFGVGLALFAADLVHFVLGHEWAAAVPLLEIMGIVTAVHHVGYNWSAFVRARGITWPMAVSGAVICAVVTGAAVPLMYSDGLVGLGIAFAIGECVGLAIRGVWLTRFFNGVSIFSQLVRAFAPTALAAGVVLAQRALLGPNNTLAHAVAVWILYVLICAGATFVLERSLLREAFGYLRKRGADAPAAPDRAPSTLIPAISE